MTPDTNRERLPVGQLLINLVRLFRTELASRGDAGPGVEGIRPAHLQVFGVIRAAGSRLTELAHGAGLSLSAMAELVDELEVLGYLDRRPDPADGRAKLICLTSAGWQAVRQGRAIIEQIEADWAAHIGADRFRTLCLTMQDDSVRQRYTTPAHQPPK